MSGGSPGCGRATPARAGRSRGRGSSPGYGAASSPGFWRGAPSGRGRRSSTSGDTRCEGVAGTSAGSVGICASLSSSAPPFRGEDGKNGAGCEVDCGLRNAASEESAATRSAPQHAGAIASNPFMPPHHTKQPRQTRMPALRSIAVGCTCDTTCLYPNERRKERGYLLVIPMTFGTANNVNLLASRRTSGRDRPSAKNHDGLNCLHPDACRGRSGVE